MAPLREVRELAPPKLMASPHRLEFHQLLLVTEGTGSYSIDSTRVSCRRGTLLWARPNQVIQSFPKPGLDADLIMFIESFPLRMPPHMGMLDDVLRPSHWQLSETELSSFQRVLSVLKEEFERSDRGLCEEMLKHLLAVILLHIDQLCRSHREDHQSNALANSESGDLFLRFRRELDRSYRSTRLVEDYAAALNCSTRALSRACRAIAGTSAKDVIDSRVALEARRLLAHTDLPISAVARQLGFSEVTNFGKFFVRRVDMTPGAFRREEKARYQ
ncbi:helix-turn-helix domain-containing protein [Streptomyces sp. NPDC051243]|uniref:helix-turn-helix domain-containing protein n=1 Tax=Streptomyces sp. NPDC051243 TaxID=3365646 RepID=UPI0037A70CC7